MKDAVFPQLDRLSDYRDSDHAKDGRTNRTRRPPKDSNGNYRTPLDKLFTDDGRTPGKETEL